MLQYRFIFSRRNVKFASSLLLLSSQVTFAEPTLSHMSTQDKDILVNTLTDLGNPELKTSGHDWKVYLDSRVKHYVSNQFDPSLHVSGPYGKLEMSAAEVSDTTWAENLSLLWLRRSIDYPQVQDVTLDLGHIKVSLDKPQVGVMRMFPRFFKSKYKVQKMGVLMHEARHSDCSPDEEIKIVGSLQKATSESEVLEALAESTCLYPHVACPAGHDFEGQNLCEAQVWGPNAVEAQFYREIVSDCKTCSDEDKVVAKTLGFERAGRLLDVEGFYEHTGPWKKLDLKTENQPKKTL